MDYIIYCVTNDVYRKLNLYKVGYTDNLEERLTKLHSTGVAGGPFYAIDLKTIHVKSESDAKAYENFIHGKLCEYRDSFDREFFKIEDLNIIKPFFKKDIMEEKKDFLREDNFLNFSTSYIVSNDLIKSRQENIRRAGEAISHLKAKKRAYKGKEGEWALSELFDNAYDNHPRDGKKRIFEVKYNNNGHLIIMNNCPGFKTKKDFRNFLEHYFYHINNGKNTIGFNGAGAKDAIIALSDYESNEPLKISDTIIGTSFDGKTLYKTVWHVCEDEKRYLKYEDIIECDAKGFIGSYYDIEKPTIWDYIRVRDFFEYEYSSKPDFFELFDVRIARSQKNIITINERKDPMYLDELGDNINTDGVHIGKNKNMIFSVNSHTARNEDKNDIIKFKTITVFIPSESKNPNIKRSGIFERYEGKYLGEPKIHPNYKSLSYSKDLCNILIDYENVNTARVFGVREQKNEGGLLFNNAELDEYKDENGLTPSEIIVKDYNYSLNTMYREYVKTKGKATCVEDKCKLTLGNLNEKFTEIPMLTNEEKDKVNKIKEEKKIISKEKNVSELEKAIEEYNNLPEKEKSNIDVKYKYTSNFCTFIKKCNPPEGSKIIGNIEDYFEIMPWNIIDDIYKNNELELYYYVITNEYTTFRQNKPTTEYLLNDFVKKGYNFLKKNSHKTIESTVSLSKAEVIHST